MHMRLRLFRTEAPAFAGATWIALLLLAVLVATPAFAQNFPKLTGRVVDQANILTPEQELDLSSKSDALEAQTGRQFVVANAEAIPAPDNCCDAVTSIFMLHELPPKVRRIVIGEAARVLLVRRFAPGTISAAPRIASSRIRR